MQHCEGAVGRFVIDDKMWEKLEPLLPKTPKGGRPGANNRVFIEAVCWVIRTGAPWRDMPAVYGNWKTVYNRYSRWVHRGYMTDILNLLKKRWQPRKAFD
jgi:transposase